MNLIKLECYSQNFAKIFQQTVFAIHTLDPNTTKLPGHRNTFHFWKRTKTRFILICLSGRTVA